MDRQSHLEALAKETDDFWFIDDTTLYIKFDELAKIDPLWASQYRSQNINWKDPLVNVALAKAVMSQIFGLSISLRMDRLCPAIPSRYEYVAVLQMLVDTTGPNYANMDEWYRPIRGIDIGVGASCVYPLLACACRPNWSFIGTELDELSFKRAEANVYANFLPDRISLYHIKNPKSDMLPTDLLPFQQLAYAARPSTPVEPESQLATFTMCNPPFYSSVEEMARLQEEKSQAPASVNTGAKVELITEGGEEAFILRHIKQSLVIGKKIQWYTSLVGRRGTLERVMAELRALGLTNWLAVTLQPGNQTRRWVIAWSFQDYRPPMALLKVGHATDQFGGQDQHLDVSWNTETTITVTSDKDSSILYYCVGMTLRNWGVDCRRDEQGVSLVVFVYRNVWNRQARRNRARGIDEPAGPAEEGDRPIMVAKVVFEEKRVVVRWMRGEDRGTFDSFCGWVENEVNESR